MLQNKQNYRNSIQAKYSHMTSFQTVDDNHEKQFKPSTQQYYKQNSLKGSIARSICPSTLQSNQQLLQYFTNYQYNQQYIDMKRMQVSQYLKLKRYKQSVYYGEFINGKRHGQGIMVYNQGIPLTNTINNNLQNIPVKLNQENQQIKFRIYEGEWENDYKHGKGIQKFANGTLYQGFYVNGKPQGVGRYAWPNGEFYQGQWLNGMKHGSGMWKGAKGDSYVGEWKFGKADGYGVHTWINGDRYEGQFKDCLKHGQGLQKFSNGDIYKGYYTQGKPSGFGQYYWTNGSYFKGTFKTGLRNGHGIWKKGPGNSDKYQGQYLDDKKSGYGIFTWSSGNVYKGNYQNDSRNGYGQMYWTDGSFYKGDWWNGIQHGKGQIYVPGDGIKRGIFQNNTLVSIDEEFNNYNQMPRNELLREGKQYSQKQQTSKTRQKFRSRAYSTQNKKSKQSTQSINQNNHARVFKLVDLKQNHHQLYQVTKNKNPRSSLQSRDSSFHSTTGNKGGFIRFGGIQTDGNNDLRIRRMGNSKSIQSQGKKERIMHSAFYMHKFHNEMEKAQNTGSRVTQFQRSNFQ